MTQLAGRRLVVLNTSSDTIELLKTWFELEGMVVSTATVTEFRTRGADLRAFIARADPDVIIFDVALPYMTNWAFFTKAREDGVFNNIPVILTTTNEAVLRAVIGESPGPVHELVGKPVDMQSLTARVLAQLAGRGVTAG